MAALSTRSTTSSGKLHVIGLRVNHCRGSGGVCTGACSPDVHHQWNLGDVSIEGVRWVAGSTLHRSLERSKGGKTAELDHAASLLREVRFAIWAAARGVRAPAACSAVAVYPRCATKIPLNEKKSDPGS